MKRKVLMGILAGLLGAGVAALYVVAGAAASDGTIVDPAPLLENAAAVDRLAELTVDYPADGSIVPPDMVAPTFLWHDSSGADSWLLEVAFDDAPPLRRFVAGDPPPAGEIDPRCLGETNEKYEPTEYQASARSWRPVREDWSAIQRASSGSTARLTFLGFRRSDPQRPVSRGTTELSTSLDPVGAPIFYRDVPLMPAETEDGTIKPLAKGAVPLIDWRLRSVSRDSSRIVLRDMPTCANCHSFSADGATMGMDVDGPQGDKGAYAIAAVNQDSGDRRRAGDHLELVPREDPRGTTRSGSSRGSARMVPTRSPPSTRRSTSRTSRPTGSSRCSIPPAASSPGTRRRPAR